VINAPQNIRNYSGIIPNLRAKIGFVNLEVCMPGNWPVNPAISDEYNANFKRNLKNNAAQGGMVD
jgi:hypothetical protein